MNSGGSRTRGNSASEISAAEITLRIEIGEFQPGEKLNEVNVAADLGISRNTLREAFRLLVNDGLVTYVPHRGVFVSEMNCEDITDIWAFRRLLELGAASSFAATSVSGKQALVRMNQYLRDAELAAEDADWGRVATDNSGFHQALVDSTGSCRVSAAMRSLLAQARLVFMCTEDWENTHSPYMAKNESVFYALATEDNDQAVRLLRDYLKASERHMKKELEEK